MLGVKRGSDRSRRRPNWPFCLNAASWQTDGLISWWPMNCRNWGPNTTLDLSPYRNHAYTMAGSVQRAPTNRPDGGVGIIRWFQQTNAHRIGGFKLANYPTSFTIAAWAMQISQSSAISLKNIYGDANGFVTGSGLCTYSNTRKLGIYCDGGYRVSNTASPVLAYNHLVCTSDGATYRWYLNGIPDGSYTMTTPVLFPGNNGRAAWIGASAASAQNNAIEMYCAEVRAYNRVLSPSEIRELYKPSGRWELYYQPRRKVWFTSAAAPPAPTNQGATLPMMGV